MQEEQDREFRRFVDQVLYEHKHASYRPSPSAGGSSMSATRSPVERWLDYILLHAARERVSDIHLEPQGEQAVLQFRIDGFLCRPYAPFPKEAYVVLLSRIKIVSQMNVSESRRPQDGSFSFPFEKTSMDVRVATLPTVQGESVVLRLLSKEGHLRTLEELDLLPENAAKIESLLREPQGLLFVSGPMGSGKTVTLFSLLQAMNQPHNSIITIEDPVEYRLSGIRQVQISEAAGVTFADILKDILRHDANIIAVSETRDAVTAKLSVRAALTGHRVFSTIHTEDSALTVLRMIEMGIPAYLLRAAFRGAIAQRLVRRICPHCQKKYEPGMREKALLGSHDYEGVMLTRGEGCEYCRGTGYHGRIALQEVLVMDETLERCIGEGMTYQTFRHLAIRQGMVPLWEDGIAKVLAGKTTLSELQRVLA
jgi:type IV pilus assembly protein PilB